jgi:Glycosyl hydrolases family 32 N-terminal domain
MLYEPARPDRYLWDTWLLPTDDGYHLFHMQKVAGEVDSIEVGHAFSSDLVRWTTLEPALTVGPPGAWDSVRLRTGAALWHEGRYYLFYGAAPDHVDRVGLATSTDLVHWERLAGNPLTVPDGRWYEHDHATCPIGNVAWRDPCIRRDGDGWIMYLTARHLSGPVGGRGTVATLRARAAPPGGASREADGGLRRWEVGPPLDVPYGFNVLEVPDVFELEGRWFLLHSTSHRMGTRFPTCDPALTAGTFVLWAERPEGPFERPPRDVLVGSAAQRMTAYVCRTADTALGRIAYYHNVYPARQSSRGPQVSRSPQGPRGSFALPKGLAVDERGLKLRYLPLLEPYRGPALAPPLIASERGAAHGAGEWVLQGDEARGLVQHGTSAVALEGQALDVMLTTTLTIEEGQGAGIGVRVGDGGRGLGVLLDARQATVGVVELGRAAAGVAWQVLAERRAAVRAGVSLALRVIVARSVVDVFVDDELMLSVVAEGHRAGKVVLIADSARVRFADMRATRLALPALPSPAVPAGAAGPG